MGGGDGGGVGGGGCGDGGSGGVGVGSWARSGGVGVWAGRRVVVGYGGGGVGVGDGGGRWDNRGSRTQQLVQRSEEGIEQVVVRDCGGRVDVWDGGVGSGEVGGHDGGLAV